MDVMTRTRWDLCAVALLLTVPLVVRAQNAGTDWPQFRGPNRDGGAAAFKEPQSWPNQLTKKWTVNVGEGYATPLIVGGLDGPVIGMNRRAAEELRCEHRLELVPGATHLFEEPGKLEEVAQLARSWFLQHVTANFHGATVAKAPRSPART